MTQTLTALPGPGAAMRFSLSQTLYRARRACGSKVAVTDPEGALTWDELARTQPAARRRAAAARHGHRRSRRDAGQQQPRYLEYYYGVPWGGGIFTPLNFRLAPAELTAILVDADARILLVDDANLHLVAGILPGTPVRHVVHVGTGPTPPGMLDYEALLSAAAPAEDAGRAGDDVACLFYTSGSTGRPKGVMQTHTNLLASALAFAAADRAERGQRRDGVRARCSTSERPASRSRRWSRWAASSWCRASSPADALACIERHRVTITSGVPTMLRMMIDHPDARRRDLSSMRTMLYGAAPMPESLVVEARALLPERRLHALLRHDRVDRQRDLPAFALRTRPEHRHLGKASSVGRPLIGVDVEIVDADDRTRAGRDDR